MTIDWGNIAIGALLIPVMVFVVYLRIQQYQQNIEDIGRNSRKRRGRREREQREAQAAQNSQAPYSANAGSGIEPHPTEANLIKRIVGMGNRRDVGPGSDFRYKAGRAAIVGVALIGFIALFVSLDLMVAEPMRDSLRQVYKPQRVLIATLKTNGPDSCGYYSVGTDPQKWRYLNTEQGLWAEGVSKAWRSPALFPAASADLTDRWQGCMTRTGRGHALDWLMTPLSVEFLNLT